MSEGKRPGGLTALAVLNFVFGAYGLLSALTNAVIAGLVMSGSSIEDLPDEMQNMIQMLRDNDLGPIIAVLAGGALLVAVLQIIAGIGYLQQKRSLGRGVGNVYAIGSITLTVVPLVAMQLPEAEGMPGGFQLLTLLLVIYPILTLILLNTTFKHDFVR